MKVILGKKLHMTQKFTDAGVIPVTVVAAGPCTVTQVKGEKDGYVALQIGFGDTRKQLAKPQAGHLRGLTQHNVVREFRMPVGDSVKRGQTFTVAVFKPGDMIEVTGVSKGKGFQGVVRRHGFHGSPATHGHKDQLRMPGSIGAGGVQRVLKGTRMAGRMGGDQVTVKNLQIVEVDEANNLLYVKGAVPGGRNALVIISGPGEMVFTEPTVAEAAPAQETEVAAPAHETVEAPAVEPVVEASDVPQAEAEKPAEESTNEETK